MISFFREAFKIGRQVFFALPRKKTKEAIKPLISEFFGPMKFRKKKENFNIYELNSHQRLFSLNMDEFQSSYANWKCRLHLSVYLLRFVSLCYVLSTENWSA